MRHRLRIIAFCLLGLSAAPMGFAHEDARAPAVADVAATAPPRGALFAVRQGNHTLYLFGTIHVGNAGFYPLEPRVMQALAQASKLALELDPLADPAGMQKLVERYGVYPAGHSLDDDLPAPWQQRLDQLLAPGGGRHDPLVRFKPWLVDVLLTMSQFAAKGYDPALAVDAHLATLAHRQHKPIVELETAESQLGLFGNLPVADQLLLLKEHIKDFDSAEQRQTMMEVVDAWRQADPRKLETLARKVAEDTTFAGRFMQRDILEKRNPGLALGMARLLASEERSFAAVGILHLIGKDSVPELLRQRGLTVERVY